jgi:hypothetical protein
MTISSRRYLLAYEHVIKYLEFAEIREELHLFTGITPNILSLKNPVGFLLRYRLSVTVIASLKLV